MTTTQAGYAAAVERLGAGRVLSTDASIGDIRSAVRDLLDSKVYRKAAKQMSTCFLAEADRWPIEDEIEALAAEADGRRRSIT